MSRYKIVFSSVATFENLRVILVNYLILPIVSLIMLLLITANGNEDYLRIVLGSVITVSIIAGIGVITSSFVHDQSSSVINDILSIRPKFSDYWLPKFVIAMLVIACEMSVLGIIGLITLQRTDLLLKFVSGFIFVVLISMIFGYICAIAGLNKQNPFWLANFLGGSMVILSGVIIPVAQYPMWLKIFAGAFPISDLLDWLIQPEIFSISLYLMIAKIFGWFAVATIFYRFKWKLK